MKNSLKITITLVLILSIAIIYVATKALEYRSHINEYLDKYNNVVSEFSGRSVFAEKNKSILSDTIVPGRVVLLGTQLISAWNLADSTSELQIINRGINNQRSAGLLLRFQSDVISLGPSAVLIEISSYNLRPEFDRMETQDFVKSMVEIAQANQITPILTTMIPIVADSGNIESFSIRDSIKAYNNWITKYCTNENIAYVDFNQLTANSSGELRPELSSGPIDLNESGYLVISSEAIRLLRDIIKN